MAAVAVLLGGAVLLFELSVRQLTGSWLAFGTHPDVMLQLELSLGDQKRLAASDPPHAALYRRRFAAIEALLDRLRILRYNREEIAGRYRAALLIVFATLAGLGVGAFLVAKAREQARLGRLRAALARLAAGDTDIDIGSGERRRRDLLGRMGAMVEEASRTMARDRRRLASLENLAAWQEAARRHAHEIRTPLTAARLELDRLDRLLGAEMPAGDSRLLGRQLTASTVQELDRLARFTTQFASFARLPRPRLQEGDLAAFVDEFVRSFAGAWRNLTLRPPVPAPESALAPAPAPMLAAFDRDLLRQVLVNLCDNSSLAIAGAGSASFALAVHDGWMTVSVADDGRGVAAAVRARLFEPYATTRRVGEGMGLGLAISRKILLDHGGDLELASSSAAGPGPFVEGQLRQAIPETDGLHRGASRAVRPREGLVHGRGLAARGRVRRGRRRHHLPRRDRRHARSRPAGRSCCACCRRSEFEPRRRQRHEQDRRARRRRHQQATCATRSTPAASAPTSTSAWRSCRCGCRRCASAWRTCRCSPRTSCALRARASRRRGRRRRRRWRALALLLAGQRARAAQPVRAAGSWSRTARCCRSRSSRPPASASTWKPCCAAPAGTSPPRRACSASSAPTCTRRPPLWG
jgi:signal transduction histidine kinase